VIGATLIFRERPNLLQKISVPILAVGLYFLLSGGSGFANSDNAPAIFCGLGAAATYAVYILASSRLQKSIDPLTSGLYVIFFASLGLILFHQPDFARLASFSSPQLMVIAGIAIVCTVLPLVLFLSGLQKLGNTEASILSTIEPLTAAFLSTVLLEEVLTQSELLGGGLVVLALITTAIGSSSPDPKTYGQS
jgi:drug/metabolite transporter (DMT)-like permease